jgi:signal transduction histidine kinase/CheY-like chemotaxis protein
MQYIAQVINGDLNVKVNIDNDVDDLTELGIAIQYLIEDLNNLQQDKEITQSNLEMQVIQRTREMDATIRELQQAQRRMIRSGWNEYLEDKSLSSLSMYLQNGKIEKASSTLTENMAAAIENESPFEIDENSISLPIYIQGEPIGVVEIEKNQSGDFSSEDLDILSSLIEQVGRTLENQRLFEQTQGALSETDALFQASKELNQSSNYFSLLEVFTKFSLIGAIANHITIFSFDSPWTSLYRPQTATILASLSLLQNEISNKKQSIETDLKHFAIDMTTFQSANSLLSRSTSTTIESISQNRQIDEKTRWFLLDNFNAEKVVFIPLLAADKWIGFLTVIFEEDINLDESDINHAFALTTQISVALQNIQNIKLAEQRALEASKRSSELTLINQILEGITTSPSLEKGLQVASEAIKSTLQIDDVYFGLKIKSNFNMIAGASKNNEHLAYLNKLITEKDDPLLIKIINNQTIQILDKNFEIPENSKILNDFYNEKNINNFIIIPIVSAQEEIGVIIMIIRNSNVNLTEEEEQLFEAISHQTATAIHNALLLDETTQRARQLETASEIARDSSANLEMDTLLNRAVNLIKEKFNFHHVSIYLREGMKLVIKGSTSELMTNPSYKVSFKDEKIYAARAAKSSQTLIINNVASDPAIKFHPLSETAQAFMFIPMNIGERVTGVLEVCSTNPNQFSSEDITVLQVLSDQISVAMENARSFEVTQQAMAEIREADRLKTQFLANMSHELRTPLNSIIGFSQVILKEIDGPITETQKEDLSAIHNSGQHLLNMINSILDISKIEAGKMEISIEEIDLQPIFKTVLSTAIGLVKEKPIKLLNNIPTDLPNVWGDETRIRQILTNLYQNAAKFTNEGTITLNVEKTFNEYGDEQIKISVTDTGIGIAKMDQEKLFVPFSQVDDSPTRKAGGTGLGLSLCKAMVEMQGGNIGVESELSKGSTFWFTIPTIINRKPGIDDTVELSPIRTILSIDDDEQVSKIYQKYLSKHQYHILVHTDPMSAVTQAALQQPDIILLDIAMPTDEGWHILEQLKENKLTQHIPVVICSIINNQEKGYSLGASAYLVKPIIEEDLIQTLSSIQL